MPHPLPEPDGDPPAGWRWGPRVGTWSTAGAAVVGTAVAAVAVRSGLDPSTAGLWLLGGAVLCAALGALVGALAGALTSGANAPAGSAPAEGGTERRRALGTALIGSAGVVGVIAVLALASGHGWPPLASGWAVAAVVAGALVLLGRYSPLGWRAGLAGTAAVVGATVLWEATASLVPAVYAPSGSSQLGTVALVVSVVALGLPPRLALGRAGLTGPDGRRAGATGAPPGWSTGARTAAHRELGVVTLVLVASTVAGGWLALNDPGLGTVSLSAVLVLLLCARARAYPLAAEVLLLRGAALVLLARLVAVWLDAAGGVPFGPLALAVGVAAVPFVALTVGPLRPVGERRLRRMTQWTETMGTLALLPLALGSLGMYAHLVGSV